MHVVMIILVYRKRFPQCFDGVGKLKDCQVSLHVDRNAGPVAQTVGRIPFDLGDMVKAIELSPLEKVLGADRPLYE